MIFKAIPRIFFLVASYTLISACWLTALSSEVDEELLDGRGAHLEGRSSDVSRMNVCQYRENVLPVAVFPLYTGYACLNYNDISIFVGDEKPVAHVCTLHVLDLSHIYPCYKRGNDSLPFVPTDAEAYKELSLRFKKLSDAERWRRCYQASLQCCDRIVTPSDAEQDPSRCPQLWDGWDCWDSAPEDTFQTGYCKEYVYSADAAPSCPYTSKKHCFSRKSKNSSSAQWNQTTDYSGCSTKWRLLTNYTFHVVMLSLSIALSLPAIVIFFCYRRLRIPRIALHRNLLIVIVIRSTLTILQIELLSFNSLLTIDEVTVMNQNGVGCKILSSLVQLFSNAVFAMMLAEGFFLHRLIAAVFKSQPNMAYLYCSTAAISALPMVPWTVLRILKYDYSCWATGADYLDWINSGPRVAFLVINFFLMLDIIRVLLTKLRGVNSWHSDKIKRTARSTLFLLPLFGVNTLVVADKPATFPSCDWESVFDMVSHAMEGLQGPSVALLYCYLNKEVKMYLKKTVSEMIPKLGALRRRVSTQLTRHTFTTNVGDDPAEGGGRGDSSSSAPDVEIVGGGRPSQGRRSTTLAAIGEAREPTDVDGDNRGSLPCSEPTFEARNRFRDDAPARDSARIVAEWNIPPHAESFRDGRGETSDSHIECASTQDSPEDTTSDNSSPDVSRTSLKAAGQLGGTTDISSPPLSNRVAENREGTRETTTDLGRSGNVEDYLDSSKFYSGLVFGPSSNSVVQDKASGSNC